MPWCRPGAVMTARLPRLSIGHDRRRRCLASPETVRSPGMAATEGARRVRELQISSLFCKPTCKPDTLRQLETGETDPTERDGSCPVRRGHCARERHPETGETHVVWLITQRSRVQIPPPLPRPEALSRTEKGPSACGLLTDLLTKPVLTPSRPGGDRRPRRRERWKLANRR